MLAAVWHAQRGTLILWVPVAFGTGIWCYFSRAQEPGPITLWGLAGFCVVMAALAGWRPLRGLAVMAACAALGFLCATFQSERVAAPVLEAPYRGPVVGRLVGIDRSERNRLRLMLDQVQLPGTPLERVPERVRVVLAQEPMPEVIFAGAQIMVSARLGPPPPPVEPDGFDFRRHAWFLRLGAIGYAAKPAVLASPRAPPPLSLRVFDLRLRLAEAIRRAMPGQAGGFAAAILTGERSGVDPADLVDLRASNLAHLLAISGLHMGLMCGAVFATVRFLLILLPGVGLRIPAKKYAAVAAICAGAAYLVLSGASVATQRAFVMATVMLLAVVLDRPALTLRAVALAALIVLMINPVALMGPGFQMSFSATVALIAAYGWLKDRALWQGSNTVLGTVVRAIVGLTVTSLVAGLATAPFAAFHFNQFTRFGLIANLLAVPAMGFVVMPAALLALVLLPVGLEGIGLGMMEIGINHILRVAHWTAGLDGSVTPVPSGPGWVLGAISLGGVALALSRGPPRGAGLAVVCAALIGWSQAKRPDVLIAPEGKLIGVIGPQGRALSTARGQGFAARVWLENDGDASDQKLAAGRAGQAWVTHWTGEGALPAGRCSEGHLIIAPSLKSPPKGGCIFVGFEALRTGGAHAISKSGGITARTSRAASGLRLWTDPTQR